MATKPRLRILLVEDNETHAHLVRRHLKKTRLSEVEVDEAGTLAAAIQAARDRTFDAVLLDLSLPDSEIPETLSRFLEAIPNVPTIVLTSLDDLDFASRLVHQGADDFLVKSDIGSQILLRSIRYAIERRKSRQELADYASRLERSNRELKSFAHTIAHEVRSPLNIVTCCLSLIREDHGDELDKDSLDAIADSEKAIRDMTELVTDLLDYSRVEHDGGEFKSVEMNVLVHDVLATFKTNIETTAATITLDELPTVEGNEVQLRQVFRNLIGNAMKYRDPSRSLNIHLSCKECVFEWTISVRDNGLGIPEESLTQIFDPFVRVHESSGVAGTGIGLSFCSRIIDNHGGRIWAQRNRDVGTTIHFTIPKSAG